MCHAVNRRCQLAVIILAVIGADRFAAGHPIIVDGNVADWTISGPSQNDVGHIGRNSSNQGVYAWKDFQGDQRNDLPPSAREDITRFQITGSTSNLYFRVSMQNIDVVAGDGAPQIQIAVDLDHVSGSGQVFFAGFADTSVGSNAAWEFLVQTRFGSGQSNVRVWTPSFTSTDVGSAAISSTEIEISVPWSALGLSGPPTSPLRFTVASFRSNPSDNTFDIGGPSVSNAIDAVTNYGDPGLVTNTFTEVSDGVVNYFFDVHFESDGDVYAPLLISKVLYDPPGTSNDPSGEWIEIFNASPSAINLQNYKLGDEETVDGGEGMRAFPGGTGSTIASGGRVVVANTGVTFQATYMCLPNFVFTASNTAGVPVMVAYPAWALSSGTVALANSGDEILLLDTRDTVLDVVTYGSGFWPGVTTHPTVGDGQSIERVAVGQDTNNCPNDFDPQSVPAACPPVCGNGIVQSGETCDDGNTAGGDGCSSICSTETGYTCTGSPSACTAICGDGLIRDGETCDDGNASGGDGCSGTCQTESGWNCGTPGQACTPMCGDGLVVGNETCDDGNTAGGDGCSGACATESGWQCSGTPSTCSGVCGDGLVVGSETCDDSNTAMGDGCSGSCTTESGWQCSGAPSACSGVCGDGLVVGSETCDDGNSASGDGCGAACTTESGWQCSGAPSTCTGVCGDGLVVGGETCDDGNSSGDDGCSASCQTETGWSCPSSGGNGGTCSPICGDGLVVGGETCDDGNAGGDDGCSATCHTETGWSCPSSGGSGGVCSPICGDGLLRGSETCDDGGTAGSDGCSASCQTESGWTCSNEPSSCSGICGDGLVVGSETCDDGDTDSGDGCSSACTVETGYTCTGAPSVCCPSGQTNCSGMCVNTQTDTSNCGMCGNACAAGQSCVGGTCGTVCSTSQQCDDGNLCNGTETCMGGLCQAGVLAPNGTACNDGDQCTVLDSCQSGMCVGLEAPAGTACDDGDACTVGDVCQSGMCVGGQPNTCNGNGTCTSGACNCNTGYTGPNCQCAPGPNDAGTYCNGMCVDTSSDNQNCGSCGNACAVGQTCMGGMCVGGATCTADSDCGGATPYCETSTQMCVECLSVSHCNDNNSCTGDSCVSGVCHHVEFASGTACDDGNACTVGDVCQNGMCQAGATPNTCNGNGTCTGGVCVCNMGFAGTNCEQCAPDYYNYPSCTFCDMTTTCSGNGTCNPSGGCNCNSGYSGPMCQCGPAPSSVYCDGMCANTQTDNNNCGGCNQVCQSDGQFCDGTESCQGGMCVSSGNPCSARTPACDEVFDLCRECLAAADCNDGNPCTSDQCTGYTCQHTPVNDCCQLDADCNDGNVCTQDLCVNNACQHNAVGDGTACSDGDPCTAGDVCVNGMCQPGMTNTCNGNGTCDPMTGGCACNPGFAGVNCDQCASNYYNYPTCTFCLAATTCSGNGTCSGSGGCNCSSGFTGPNCQCGPGTVYSNGMCCPTGQTNCGGMCVNTQTDPQNCGLCGLMCPAGYTCVSGACVANAVCGDGILQGGEMCDDGNAVPFDGCSQSCQTEAGWNCPSPGMPCQPICGDGMLVGSEQCDDGNAVPFDGCSQSCQTEPGWNCPSPGMPCQPICGDGMLVGSEQCDDGNVTSGDGCSSVCQCEAPLVSCGGGTCVNTQSDPNNCGSCNTVCIANSSCLGGMCVCNAGYVLVGGVCQTCPAGQTACGDMCVDLQTDESHCGNCDTHCAGNATCCNGNCVGLQGDPNNCGACGAVCADDGVFCNGTESCLGGMCVSSGNPCTANQLCDEVHNVCLASVAVLNIELADVYTATTRCIHVTPLPGSCNGFFDVFVDFIDHDMNPATPVRAENVQLNLGPDKSSVCLKDTQHSLPATVALLVVDDHYEASTVSLEGGDNDNDDDCDINDLTYLIFHWSQLEGPPACVVTPDTRDSDFSNNGFAGSDDFAILSDHWLEFSTCACALPSMQPPATRIRSNTLSPAVAAVVDLNGDGWVDDKDVALFEERHGLNKKLSTKMKMGMAPKRRP